MKYEKSQIRRGLLLYGGECPGKVPGLITKEASDPIRYGGTSISEIEVRQAEIAAQANALLTWLRKRRS
jgi:hypothetical protein